MWAGCCFRVVLHRKCRHIFQPDAFNAVIIQVKMCNFYVIVFTYCIRVNAKSMILSGDLAFSCYHISDRMIQSTVSMVHLKCRYVIGQGQ